MTPRPDPHSEAAWLRKLDRATATHEKARAGLEELIADARAAGVPLMTIAKHTPYSREWARKIADRIDAERTSGAVESEPAAE
jgi:beta-phosphoglucomutase-like phosphatase (HAD superfamily)